MVRHSLSIFSAEEKISKSLQEEITDIVTRMKSTDINRTYTDLTLQRGIAMMLSSQMPRAVAMTVKGAFGKSKMGKISDLFHRAPKEEMHFHQNMSVKEQFVSQTMAHSNLTGSVHTHHFYIHRCL